MARYTTSGQKTSLEALNAELEKIAVSQEDLLSRVGDTPNQIEYNLDMNNNRILNLPTPANPSDPVRLQDLTLPEIIGILYETDLTTSPTATSGVLRAEDAYAATSINFHTGHAPDKSEVGLGNVDNTSDVNKPVSTAQSTAIGLKADTTALAAHTADISNPHSVTQTQVGLSNVNNTSDANKPVSTATQTALDLKASTTSLDGKVDDTQVLTNVPAGAVFTDTTYSVGDGGLSQISFTSADNTKLDNIAAGAEVNVVDSVAGKTGVVSLVKADVGLNNVNNTSDANKPVSTEQQTALDLKANQVGLSNVDNTSDADKPVSTAQQAALDLKANGSSLNRRSLLDNPLCHLFKTNKLVETSAPTGADSDITFTRASTATYVDRYGIVKTAAVDTIREEKDGFLIEQAGTNLVPYSEAFDNAAWEKVNTVITPNATTSPDGTVNASKLDYTILGGVLKEVIVNTTAASFTFSMWIKSTGADRPIRIKVRNSPTTTNSAQTDFTATSEWQRFSVTLSSLAEAMVLEIRNVEIDSEFYIWGAQLEQSLSSTSYIPTVATPVTRIADKALLPVLNNVVTKEFSIFGILSNKSVNTNTGTKRIFTIPTLLGYFTLFHTQPSNTFIFRYDDTSTPLQLSVISTENTVYFAITMDESNVKLNINGTEVTATTLSDPSLLLSASVFFLSSTGAAQWNGNIKDFRIYDFALNANEIEYLLP
jgi:hypothetical protein